MPLRPLLLSLLIAITASLSAGAQPSDSDLRLEVAYLGDLAGNLSGGLRQRAVYFDNVDVTLTARDVLGWPHTTLFLYGLGNQGGNLTRLVGDAQTVSNIEAPNAWKLYEAWIQQILFEGRVSVLAGLYDLNSEFDVISSASLFLNSSHGIGPDFSQSGQNGPSIFPTTSVGLRARLLPHHAFYVQAVALDGVPGHPDRPAGTHVLFDRDDGLLLAAEAALLLGMEDEPETPFSARRRRARYRRISRLEDAVYRVKVALGAWRYTARFDDLAAVDGQGVPTQHTDNGGVYALAEGHLWREAADPAQGLWLFARAGVANRRVNRFGAYTGAGAVYVGPLAGRAEDRLGLAVASAFNGDPYQAALRAEGRSVERAEVNLELTYHAPLTSWLAVQADLQVVLNPDTDPALGDALVAILRLEVTP